MGSQNVIKQSRQKGMYRPVFAVALSLILFGAMSGCSARTDAAHLMESARYDEAARSFEQQLQNDSTSLRLPVLIGYSYFKAGKFEACRSALQKESSPWQTREYALFWIGLSYIAEGNGPRAIAVWRTYASTNTEVRRVVHEALKALEFGRVQAGQAAADRIEREVNQANADWLYYQGDVTSTKSRGNMIPDRPLVRLAAVPYLP